MKKLLYILIILALANSFGFITQNDKQGHLDSAFATDFQGINNKEFIMKTLPYPTQERINELLEWDLNGIPRWIAKIPHNRGKIGDIAGYSRKDGRRKITLDRTACYASRLHYISVYGEIPISLDIDHIDRIKSNDRIENLRAVTKNENSFNLNNIKGYSWHKYHNKWTAHITVNGKQKHLGVFSEEAEAADAYLKAKKELHIIEDRRT